MVVYGTRVCDNGPCAPSRQGQPHRPTGGAPGTGRKKIDSAWLTEWYRVMKKTSPHTAKVLLRWIGTKNQARWLASWAGGVFLTLIAFGNALAVAEVGCGLYCGGKALYRYLK